MYLYYIYYLLLLFCFSYNDYTYFWVPILGPHIGAVIGAHIYYLFIELHWPDDYETGNGTDASLQENGSKTKDEAFNMCEVNERKHNACKFDDSIPLLQENSYDNNDLQNEIIWVRKRDNIDVLNNTDTHRRKGNFDFPARESVL